MTNKELFVNAFIEAEKIEYAGYLDKSFFTFEFSPKFEKKMSKLVSKEHLIKFSTRRKISKLLIAAVVAIIVMFTGLMSVSANRRKAIDFIEKIFPKHITVELTDDSIPEYDYLQTEYTLSSVPNGYKLIEYDKSEYSVWSVWKNENDDEIVFSQTVVGGSMSIDNEHNLEYLKINGYKAYFVESENNCTLFWNDSNYSFMIDVPINEKENIIKMAKNIVEK